MPSENHGQARSEVVSDVMRNVKFVMNGTDCVLQTDENSIRRQNSRKPFSDQSPSSHPSQPSTSKKKDPKACRSGYNGFFFSRMKFFSAEFKLLIQFLVIFFSYLIYSISNIVLTYQLTVTTDNRWDKDLLKIFRLMIWAYHLINPIIFLSFHPIILNKFTKKSCCFCKTSSLVSCLVKYF